MLEKLGPLKGPAVQFPDALRERLTERGVNTDAPRLATAESARALCEALNGLDGRALVEAIARFEAQTSPSALARQLPQLATAVELLKNDLVFGPFAQLAHRRDAIEGATELLQKVEAVLRQDEINAKLVDLRQLANRAQALVTPEREPGPGPKPGEVAVVTSRVDARGGDAGAKLDALVAEIRAALEKHGDDARLVGSLEVRVPKK